MQAQKITFEFKHKGELYAVVWEPKGPGIVNGQEFFNTYRVTVDQLTDYGWRTAKQVNITNSKHFLKQAINEKARH